MSNGKRHVVIQVDKYTRVCLTVIAALLTVVIIGLWSTALPSASQARAAGDDDLFGNSGGQRQAIIKAQEQTTAKIDDLIKVLKSGEVKVQIAGGGDGASSKNK
ncbi:MAG: hypothetical protein EHM48_10250 [Planctomycetaceae bacterium]|nr:MAG: hypothetical protein EHM48_10250 [Planctomycetaceae bacterium]